MLNPKANLALASALDDVIARFSAANPKSMERHERAKAVLPGGNTRAVMYYPPFPVSIVQGEGCHVTDMDGHVYVDFVTEYTAGLYGHSNPSIAAALKGAIDDGIMLGGPNRHEAQLAAALVERFPAYERVRFCNSGTEANIMALSTARATTGRKTIMIFREGYHGGVLSFSKNGSPLNVPYPYVTATYNDMEGTRALIRQHAADLAAVILEPMLGGGGCILATPEFLTMLREETSTAGALMILDEVMTSRLAYDALHGALGLDPDLVTMGKYLGGGASFGVFGGRASIMDRFDPSSPDAFPHGGTFNNNVLSMAAGTAGLTQVLTEPVVTRMNDLGDQMREALNRSLQRARVGACVTGRGSMMALHFVPGPVTTPADRLAGNPQFHQLWQLEMLLRGCYVTPRGMLSLSIEVGQAEVDRFIECFEDFLQVNASVLPSA
ncbi:glutamate-1-semialdehyde 2,1-aminomutase [Rhodoligotrophos appendicifer]|uniref:aspartate aminotransferase family protein n=1 Tax=Rhodoligotrophos appendicifer TaxID=987056 RepID=UPI001185AC4F|nr:aminotransferase class III-fold pyridoxal phosphate-dependent enzyme [Rhodoligotrophos appendicifer]